MRLAVAGAGAFGTALALALARKGPVTLWARDPQLIARMTATGRSPALDLPLAGPVTLTADHALMARADVVLIAVPAQALGAVLRATGLTGPALVACCKGIDLTTLTGPAALIAATGARPLVLTGPSFATDIARGLPTALTLACRDDGLGAQVQQALATPSLRIYRTTDVTGAELGGALKNVIAIACGACIGAGFGDSARAALLTRGFAEMQRLAAALGAEPDTLMGLSGLGDLVLTCSSPQSRNFSYGLALGRAEAHGGGTVEGVATARALVQLAARTGVEMPVSAVVADLVTGRATVQQALAALLNRPLKEE
jgi:glycerol-3-phosphate dehydrogenase (NAD(P)+)